VHELVQTTLAGPPNDAGLADMLWSSRPIRIFIADDIFFAQLTAGLDFDQLKSDLAGVTEPVFLPQAKERGFVLAQGEDSPRG
jgi:hypothetical protein